jgi:5-formyltetrahydrofolate cyclo-ligase
MEEKKNLRKNMKATLKDLDPSVVKNEVANIHARLFQLDAWKTAKTVAVTVSLGSEIDTREIIERAWEEGKTVVVPKCLPKERHLDFRRISTYNNLETVYYGLLEPKVEETSSIEKDDIDLIVVPGLIFDKEGYRIGFGGGYYDRFLMDAKAVKVAQAMDEQIIENIPREHHDIPVDMILTPSQTIICGTN